MLSAGASKKREASTYELTDGLEDEDGVAFTPTLATLEFCVVQFLPTNQLSVSCHHGIFRHSLLTCWRQSEKKALRTLGNLLMALRQLLETLNLQTKWKFRPTLE